MASPFPGAPSDDPRLTQLQRAHVATVELGAWLEGELRSGLKGGSVWCIELGVRLGRVLDLTSPRGGR